MGKEQECYGSDSTIGAVSAPCTECAFGESGTYAWWQQRYRGFWHYGYTVAGTGTPGPAIGSGACEPVGHRWNSLGGQRQSNSCWQCGKYRGRSSQWQPVPAGAERECGRCRCIRQRAGYADLAAPAGTACQWWQSSDPLAFCAGVCGGVPGLCGAAGEKTPAKACATEAAPHGSAACGQGKEAAQESFRGQNLSAAETSFPFNGK